MGKGRKPIPSELKRLVGNPGGRKINNDPRVACGEPPKPDWLPPEASAIWDRVVPELIGSGVLSVVDDGVLIGYCLAFGQYREASDLVARCGLTITTGRGVIKNPACTVLNQAMDQVRKLGSELGLSPVARSRIQAPTRDEDEFETWQTNAAQTG